MGAIGLTILLAMVNFIPWYVSLPIALSLLLIPAYYHLKRNMVRYTLTDSKIEALIVEAERATSSGGTP